MPLQASQALAIVLFFGPLKSLWNLKPCFKESNVFIVINAGTLWSHLSYFYHLRVLGAIYLPPSAACRPLWQLCKGK